MMAVEPNKSDLREPPVDNSERNQKLLAWVNEEYSRCKSARANIERQWYLNLSFYFGRQNVAMVSTATAANGFKLTVPEAPPWRVRLVINKIRPIIRTELSKVTSQRPRFTVVPATGEDDDLVAARVSEQIFDSVYSNFNIKHIVRRAEWWTLICGSSFIKDYWDSNKVDKYSDQKGDFCIEPVSPFHVFVPDLLAEDLENQPYLIHATTKTRTWVENAYPSLRGRNLSETSATNEILDDAFMNIIGASAQRRNEVLVQEVWIKPGGHRMFPKGGLVTVIGGLVAQVVEQYPYAHGEFPFSKLDHMPSGKFYADSVIVDLINLQREYNRTRSQIIEAKNLMSKPKLLAAKGSIDARAITSEPGQVILFNPGFGAPTNLPMNPLPNYVLQEVQQLQADMDDISGQHEISRGQNPSQVTAATALSFLKEQDDTKLSGTIESLEIGMEKLGRHILSHVVQFWTTERTVRMVGADGTFDAQKFKGGDLRGNLDVRVEAGSGLPQSKPAKQAFVMDLLKLGLIPADRGLEMLDIGGIEKVYEDYLVDVRQAQRENLRMTAGEDVEAHDFDNHAVHIEVHNKFRKGQEYEALPEELKVKFQEHVSLHANAQATGLQPGGFANPMQDPNAPVGSSPQGSPAAPMPELPPQGVPNG